MRLAWDAIRPGGMAVVVGLAPAGVEVSLPAIEFLSDKGIRGSYYGSGDPAADLPALAALALDGRARPRRGRHERLRLDGVNDALDRLRHGAGARSILVLDESARRDQRAARVTLRSRVLLRQPGFRRRG